MNNTIIKYINNSILFVVVISYFQFFKIAAIPYSFTVLSGVFACGLMIVLIIINIIYGQSKSFGMHFSLPILFLLIGSLPSYFIAYRYHNQSFVASLWANRVLWFYLIYFYLHLYNISVKYVLRLIILVGLTAVLFFYIQYFTYPKILFNIYMFVDRGTIRLFMAGMIATQLAYFYFLNKFFTKNKIIYLVFTLLCLSIFILQGTRQLIFPLIFLTLINLLFSRRVKSKFLITLLIICSIIVFYFIFETIIQNITQVSKSQAGSIRGNIRLEAIKFFLTTFMPNRLAYIFGNGDSALGSSYEQELLYYSTKYGYYISDIGIIGDYVKYGVIFVLAGIILLIKALKCGVSPQFRYLKYYIAIQCFTLIAGRGLFGGVDIILAMVLYIFDKDIKHQKEIKVKKQKLISYNNSYENEESKN